jgi:hypothetical protein
MNVTDVLGHHPKNGLRIMMKVETRRQVNQSKDCLIRWI